MSSAGLDFAVTSSLSRVQYIFHTMKWQRQMSDPTKSVSELHERSKEVGKPWPFVTKQTKYLLKGHGPMFKLVDDLYQDGENPKYPEFKFEEDDPDNLFLKLQARRCAAEATSCRLNEALYKAGRTASCAGHLMSEALLDTRHPHPDADDLIESYHQRCPATRKNNFMQLLMVCT